MSEMESIQIKGASNFSFSATKIDNLQTTEDTLVTIVIDISLSVKPYKDLLLESLKTIIKACKKAPKAENLLIRVLTFNSVLNELHGFKSLNSIDIDKDYSCFSAKGCTALFDATYSAIGATITYAESLIKQGFNVNGIVYIITDGEDNSSFMTLDQIKNQIEISQQQEIIESLLTVVIGLNTDNKISSYLENFYKKAELSGYINAGEATPENLALLTSFVSKSISSSSQSLGTGRASNQPLTI